LKAGTEPWNKWCQCESDKSRVTVEFASPQEITGLGFKSANDCPVRDPSRIAVSYEDLDG